MAQNLCAATLETHFALHALHGKERTVAEFIAHSAEGTSSRPRSYTVDSKYCAALTASLRPARVCWQSPVAASHTRTVLSSLADTMSRPCGLKCAEITKYPIQDINLVVAGLSFHGAGPVSRSDYHLRRRTLREWSISFAADAIGKSVFQITTVL